MRLCPALGCTVQLPIEAVVTFHHEPDTAGVLVTGCRTSQRALCRCCRSFAATACRPERGCRHHVPAVSQNWCSLKLYSGPMQHTQALQARREVRL